MQGALAQQEWRVPQLLHTLNNHLCQHLAHPYKNVRDRLGRYGDINTCSGCVLAGTCICMVLVFYRICVLCENVMLWLCCLSLKCWTVSHKSIDYLGDKKWCTCPLQSASWKQKWYIITVHCMLDCAIAVSLWIFTCMTYTLKTEHQLPRPARQTSYIALPCLSYSYWGKLATPMATITIETMWVRLGVLKDHQVSIGP